MEEINNLLYDLMYTKSKEELIEYIKKCSDPIMLHFIALNYNWDDGLDIPSKIIESNFCDMGTALMIFEDAEGYMVFLENEWEENFEENTIFISNLRTRLEKREFNSKIIKYSPELSKSDIYRLKKKNTTLDNIFIEGTEGKCIEIPII